MSRIDVPDRGFGEHVDWMLARPEMAAGMGALSEAVYGTTRLPLREREAARYRIAQINECPVCLSTRAAGAAEAGIDEEFYAALDRWPDVAGLSERERVVAEFADRFAADPAAMTDEFWARVRTHLDDDDVVDLTICCGTWLGLGRMQAVLGVHPGCQIEI